MTSDIDVRATLPASPEAVWALLDDSSSWPTWTSIDSHEAVSPPGPSGLGEVRLFRTGRYTMREQIVERRPAQRLTYVLLSGLALRDYRAEIDLAPGRDGSTDLRWHTRFRPVVPGTGWLYRRVLQRATERFVEGLRHAAARSS